MMHARVLVFGVVLGLGVGVGCDAADEPDDASARERDEDEDDEDDALDGEAACEALDSLDACLGHVGCTPLYAAPLREDVEGNACTDGERFVACARTLDPCPNTDKVDCEPCPAIGSVHCDEAGVWLASGCFMPDSMVDCQAPGPIVGACE